MAFSSSLFVQRSRSSCVGRRASSSPVAPVRIDSRLASSRRQLFKSPPVGSASRGSSRLLSSDSVDSVTLKYPVAPPNWKIEQDLETVINVLKPGPIGIVEHKFPPEQINEAKIIVEKAVANWKRNELLEKSRKI